MHLRKSNNSLEVLVDYKFVDVSSDELGVTTTSDRDLRNLAAGILYLLLIRELVKFAFQRGDNRIHRLGV
jgi:hypothetical protein